MYCKVGRFVRNAQGRLIQAAAASSQERYWCVHCNKPVRLAVSKKGHAFFVHRFKRAAKNSHDFSEHRMIQATLGQMFRTDGICYQIEHEVCKGMRADIFFVLASNKQETRYVIEVQRTQISWQEIAKRMRAYKRAGIRLIWVIPKELDTSVHFSQWEQYIIAHAKFLLFYNPKLRTYYYVSDYLRCSITRLRLIYASYDMRNLLLLKKHSSRLPFTKLQQISPAVFQVELMRWVAQQKRYKRRDDLLVQWAYRVQTQIEAIPRKVYTDKCKFLNSKQPVFWMQSIIYLLGRVKGWSHEQIIKYCMEQQLLWCNDNVREIVNYLLYVRTECRDIVHSRSPK